MFTFQGTPVPTFQLGPRTLPTILKCACDELCCGICAVLCRLGASTRCQRRCALAVQVSGFNWALFTWQGTRGATSAARMLGWRRRKVLCTVFEFSITPVFFVHFNRPTRYCGFWPKMHFLHHYILYLTKFNRPTLTCGGWPAHPQDVVVFSDFELHIYANTSVRNVM